MSDYPDHLNPFKESDKKTFGRAFSRSFKGLKGFIRQSFRKKKSDNKAKNHESDDVELRKTNDVAPSYNTLRNNVMSLPSPPTYSSYTISSPPLPRSRFKERLLRSSLNNTYNSSYDEKCNPFAEDKGLNPFEEPPVPFRRKKYKKRAPLPPSCSNPDVNTGYKITGSSSKWSLTSSETDYTIDDKSEHSADVTYTQSLRECLDNFNKEMDALNKDSLEMGGSSPNILERTRNTTDSEHETEPGVIKKSPDILESDDREINNNETDNVENEKLQRSQENLPTECNEDEEKPNLTELSSEENTKDKIIDVKHEEDNNNIEVNEADEVYTSDNKQTQPLESMHREIISVITEEDEDDLENENMRESTEIYITNSIRENGRKQNFDIDNIKIKYIDDENSSVYASEKDETENCQSNNTLNNNIPKDSSPVSKQREFKLEKEVMLGGSQL